MALSPYFWPKKSEQERQNDEIGTTDNLWALEGLFKEVILKINELLPIVQME